MTISSLSRKKINAHIEKLRPSELEARAKIFLRNILSFEGISLKKRVKVWVRMEKRAGLDRFELKKQAKA